MLFVCVNIRSQKSSFFLYIFLSIKYAFAIYLNTKYFACWLFESFPTAHMGCRLQVGYICEWELS